MEKFVWREEYGVGIPSIDAQHKHFFEITNEIIDLGSKPEVSRIEVHHVADLLGNYALYHLKTEENYFDRTAYPEAARHIEAHNLYRQRIAQYMEGIDSLSTDPKALAEDFAEYSISWLSNHILLVDKKYSHYFQEHDIK